MHVQTESAPHPSLRQPHPEKIKQTLLEGGLGARSLHCEVPFNQCLVRLWEEAAAAGAAGAIGHDGEVSSETADLMCCADTYSCPASAPTPI